MEAARGGDRAALEVLLTTHYDRVHALCRRMLGNDADALDATQDALLAAVKALGRFDGRSSFGTWLYRIATNTCIDELRRRRRRPVVGFVRGGGRAESGGGGRVGHGGRGDGGGGRDGDAGPDLDAIPPGGTVLSGQGFGDRDPADMATARVDVDAALRGLPVEFRTAVVLARRLRSPLRGDRRDPRCPGRHGALAHRPGPCRLGGMGRCREPPRGSRRRIQQDISPSGAR